MDKKYELMPEKSIKIDGRKLYRIRSLKDFVDVKAGDLGGYVQSEKNLSQEGRCWIYDNGMVYDNAIVEKNATIRDNAVIKNNAIISDFSIISGHSRITGCSTVKGNASIYGNTLIANDATIYEYAFINGKIKIFSNAKICGTSRIEGEAEIGENALIESASDYATVRGFGEQHRLTTFFRRSDGEIGVVCGCFQGKSLNEFRKQVKETRNGKIAEEYLLVVDAMEKHFNEEDEEEDE